MTCKKIWKLFGLSFIFYGISTPIFSEPSHDSCGGPEILLNIVDRPTVASSACVVPFKKAVLETGYQYQKLIFPAGYQQNFPEAEFRLGLPEKNELVLLLPNYNHQTRTSDSGLSATTIGLKHQLGYTKVVASVESLFTLADGSKAFGSHGIGVTLNGIVSYNLNSSMNLSCMLGISTQTESIQNGGQRFNSINPDVVFTYAVKSNINLYAEIYGQSKTAPKEASGFNMDGGILYLIMPNMTLDLEMGQRLNGNLGGFGRYVGFGMAMMF